MNFFSLSAFKHLKKQIKVDKLETGLGGFFSNFCGLLRISEHYKAENSIISLHTAKLSNAWFSAERRTPGDARGERPAHSGTKCLKPARNKFTSVCYIMVSRVF